MKEIKHYYKCSNQLIMHYFQDDNGKPNGIFRNYYSDGTLYSEKCFNSGKRVGISKLFYSNSKLEIIAALRDVNSEGLAVYNGVKIEFNY